MNPLFEKPFTFDRVSRIVFGLLSIAGILYLLVILRNALLPFLIAWLMAYLMQPIVRFVQYKLKIRSRFLSILAVLLTCIIILIAFFVLLVPSISSEIERIMHSINTHNTSNGHIPFIPEDWLLYIQTHVDISELPDLLSKENLLDAIKQLAPRMWAILSNTFSVLVSATIVFIIFLYFIFILLDYEKIANGWKKLIPIDYRPFFFGLADDVEYSMNRYFRGQSLIALCVGILFAIGFKIIDLPLGITLGLFMGVLNLVPYLQTIGIIPMLLLALLKSSETGENFWVIFGLALLVLGIVQAIQDLFLTPKIMGKAMGLNPAIILLSLSIWGTLLGFIGLIVALPLTTLCLSYYKRFILMEKNRREQAFSEENKEEILKRGDR
ncbi:MAG: AI-2E family transporter [Massilibacteroides sp.]|nr:AI-2E family transporter [Massilibacteroides sp.]MDD3062297.1 AI-2E family transporter [Massilibacteroides sp.]MDD4660070.1 AI-2E family transporter [Massilibacteroides sp.]